MIASRDLRNHTADVLRQVSEGATVTVTVNGAPVADIVPHHSGRRATLSRAELIDILVHHQADPGLREDPTRLADDTTDGLGPIV
jgi:prevent-host-death family protein